MQWLLIRGLVREQRHWGNFLDILKEKFPEDQFHCLDSAGCGTEHGRNSFLTIKGQTKDLRERWSKLSSEGEKWGLICISLGGMIGIDWCHRFNSDFDKIVTINSSAMGLSPFYRRLRWNNYGTILSILKERDISKREGFIFDLVSNSQQLKQDCISEWTKIQQSSPVNKQNALRQLLSAATFRLPEDIHTQLLVLCSRHDRLVDYNCSIDLARHFSAPYQIHPHAGHDIPLDDSLWIVNAIKSWKTSWPTNS